MTDGLPGSAAAAAIGATRIPPTGRSGIPAIRTGAGGAATAGAGSADEAEAQAAAEAKLRELQKKAGLVEVKAQ